MTDVIDYVARAEIENIKQDIDGLQSAVEDIRDTRIDELKDAIREHHERWKAVMYMGVVPVVCSAIVVIATVFGVN